MTSLQGVGLLFADTSRSGAYAQAMASAQLSVDVAMVVRSPDRTRWGQPDQHVPAPAPDAGSEIFLPDPSIDPLEAVRAVAQSVVVSTAGTLNAEDVVGWVAQQDLALLVFSGFGGEIVGDELLAAGPPLLHLHAGWLPDFRGSTTIYYSHLIDRSCGVSAIHLAQDIDTGPLIDRRRYPSPPPGVDIDHVYDAAVRADLLVDVLRRWHTSGGVLPVEAQPADGTTYYVVHPVLKHLALDDINDRV